MKGKEEGRKGKKVRKGEKGREEEKGGGGKWERKQRRIQFHFLILPIFNARGLHWTLNKLIKY